MANILIIEDESVIRQSLFRLLERAGHTVTEAESVEQAEENKLDNYELIISDLRLPGEAGTTIISKAAPTPVLIMTSYASMRSAIDAMKMGAVDYITKPFDHDEMLMAINRVLEEKSLRLQNEVLKKQVKQQYPTAGIIGECQEMQELFRKTDRVAATDATVLVYGESGTGKELVARSIHEKSGRGSGPLISVNCAAIPETLIESELFGHEKGAFTGASAQRKGLVEAADGGTLFLDEVGELPIEAQARLLRLLQEKEIRRVGSIESKRVDVRLIAATHRNLKVMASMGEFREDLYFRLNVVGLHLPPLRERGADIPRLAEYLLEQSMSRLSRQGLSFAQNAIDGMQRYHWPGNVREMENAIERAVILCEEEVIGLEHLALDIVEVPQSDFPGYYEEDDSAPFPFQYEQEDTPAVDDPQEELSLEDYFQRFVLENQESMTETELAQKLGISRKSLWERRQKLGIPRKK